MLNVICNYIFWILALYGLLEIIRGVIYINTYTKLKTEGIYLIIAVKNQEKIIEYFLRSSLFRIFYGKENVFNDIIIADLKSEDNTKEIATRITKEYEELKVLNWKECKDMIDGINN